MESIGTVYTFAIGKPATVRSVAQALTRLGIQGATILPAVGFWKGERERSVYVHIAGLDDASANAIAMSLRRTFKQEAIYVEARGEAFLVAA